MKDEETKIKYPATCIVHWASGPINCCQEHANQLIGIGRVLGSHVISTILLEPSECINCVNEAKNK